MYTLAADITWLLHSISMWSIPFIHRHWQDVTQSCCRYLLNSPFMCSISFIRAYWLYVIHSCCRYHLVITQSIHVVHFIQSYIVDIGRMLHSHAADITWLFNSPFMCSISFICAYWLYVIHSCCRYHLVITQFIYVVLFIYRYSYMYIIGCMLHIPLPDLP